jgi:hypothetical protein
VTSAPLAHSGQQQPGQDHRGPQVDVNRFVDELHRQLVERHPVLDAGIVDQDVDATPFPFRSIHKLVEGAPIAEVGGYAENPATRGAQRIGDLLELVGGTGGEDQVHAFRRQRLGDVDTDALGGSSHERRPVLQVSHGTLLLSEGVYCRPS